MSKFVLRECQKGIQALVGAFPVCTLLLVILVIAVPSNASGRTWNVFNDGSGDAPFIQAAVDSAADGDTILVWPGAYGKPLIRVTDKSLSLISAEGPYRTRIPGAISIRGPIGQYQGNAVLSGFMIDPDVINGFPRQEAFQARNLESFQVSDCVIDGFAANSEIVHIDDLIVRDCIFRNGYDDDEVNGGALYVVDVRGGEIRGCTFQDNYNPAGTPGEEFLGGGGALYLTGSVTITECLFVDNECPSGGAAYLEGEIEFSRNTVVGNVSGDGAIFLTDYGNCRVRNNIFAWNDAFGLWTITASSQTRCWCNAYWENNGWPHPDGHGTDWVGYCTGVGDDPEDRDNVLLDPEFCDLESGDYRLMETSPMLPENHPDDVETCDGIVGALEAGCDSLPPPPAVESTSWGQIKARFRE